MILIVAPADDLHARHIRNRIDAAGGAACVLDFATLTDGAQIRMGIGPGGTRSRLGAATELIDFADVRTLWLRRPAVVRPSAAVSDDSARSFVQSEWSAAINGMALAQDHCRWVNDPFAQNAASKPIQLHRARAAGMPVPDTVITNDPQCVRSFVCAHDGKVIHKALTTPDGHLLDTRAWLPERDDPELDASLPVAPVIFQERVRGIDVRAVVIGETVLSMAVDSGTSRSEVDGRLDMDATYRAHELPGDVVRRLLATMDALGLVFGIVDLMRDDDGRYVFLEVNPQGQFLFMEILTGLPISDSLAEYLLS